MAFFSVLVEARSADDREIGRAALRAFAAAVEPYHASVSGTDRSWSARISVEAAGYLPFDVAVEAKDTALAVEVKLVPVPD